MQYYPTINTAAHSAEWLQTRREQLARLGLSGTIGEKKSVQRKAELRAINAGLKARGLTPTLVPRARELPQSAANDTARMQARAIPAMAPVGVRGYSQVAESVEAAYQPKKHSLYC